MRAMTNNHNIKQTEGDLLNQNVDVIVNSWNRNIIPWWMLLPQGVSRAIKRHGGITPFKELAKHGVIPLGGAVLTKAGKLNYKAIIHVAGINMLWRASEYSIRHSVKNAISVAEHHGYESIGMPIIGAGSGGMNTDKAKAIILDQLSYMELNIKVTLVTYKKACSGSGVPW